MYFFLTCYIWIECFECIICDCFGYCLGMIVMREVEVEAEKLIVLTDMEPKGMDQIGMDQPNMVEKDFLLEMLIVSIEGVLATITRHLVQLSVEVTQLEATATVVECIKVTQEVDIMTTMEPPGALIEGNSSLAWMDIN